MSGGSARIGLGRARRRSLIDDIVERLVAAIAESPDAPYSLPSERRLCEELEVSRASIREALSALIHLGIVEPRGQAKIADPARARAQLLSKAATPPNRERALLTDPIEVRRLLEPQVAAKAAQRATEQQLDEIERWLWLMQQALDRNELILAYDRGFHVAVAEATGNQTLADLVGALSDNLIASRQASFAPSAAAETALDDHRQILHALRARDARAARRAMDRHLDHVDKLIRAYLAETAGDTDAP
jgi:GntR family transcriptional regulator, transcriptional repressor for pyruvate dehydrogenase complex